MKTKISLIISILASFCTQLAFSQNQQKIDEHMQQIEKSKSEGNMRMAASYLNKAAYLYWEDKKYSQSIKLYSESLEINKQVGNRNGITQITFFIARVYRDKGDYGNAMTYYNKGLTYKRKAGDKFELSNALYEIANTLNESKKYKESNKLLDEANTYAQSVSEEMKKLSLLKRIYLKMSQNYQKLGNGAKATEYANLYVSFNNLIKEKELKAKEREKDAVQYEKDEINRELDTTAKRLSETETSLKLTKEEAERQKLENANLRQQQEIEVLKRNELEMEIKKNDIIRNYIIVIAIIIFISFIVVLWQFNEKKKANKQLSRQNQILENQKLEIEQQKSEIEKQNKHILASIKYARKIQDAILPSKLAITENIPNSFIFYKPRDIVSGDFYWFAKHENYLFIAAVDCTGHSVPGAFMSMIGHTLLNEIVNEKAIYETSEILKRLNAGVIYALKQDAEEAQQEDGMDLTMCRIDTKNKEFEIACANHVAYVVSDGKVNLVEGDIYSVGGFFSMKPDLKFTTHKFKVKGKTNIYMFSDGYQDQFGGERNKKFMEKRLRNMILENSNRPMKEQGTIIENKFNEWKEDQSQIDDVLLIGIELNV